MILEVLLKISFILVMLCMAGFLLFVDYKVAENLICNIKNKAVDFTDIVAIIFSYSITIFLTVYSYLALTGSL